MKDFMKRLTIREGNNCLHVTSCGFGSIRVTGYFGAVSVVLMLHSDDLWAAFYECDYSDDQYERAVKVVTVMAAIQAEELVKEGF